MKSKGSVTWTGGLRDGQGVISTESDAMNKVQYSFGTRFEGDSGTNPEELIAAAHASCYSMALAKELGEAGINPRSIKTTATVTLDTSNGPSISDVHLDVAAALDGSCNADEFQRIAEAVKDACPVSKVLKADISLSAKLAA